ncbi:MAG: hypothetical protein KAT38_09350, partial [Bacteroidales bacterium]|nr:hypothetical protein [Bacteroidales bacterium]
MKKFLLLFGMVLVVCSIVAQTPQAFNYQAIARDKAGNILSNQQVSIKISILQGDVVGPAVYQETHTSTTNDFGLINLSIGNGNQELEGFNKIDWSQGPYFIKIEMDENGGSNYREMGTAELLSVPYALYAESTGSNTRQADTDWGISGNHVYTGIASDPSCQSGNVGIGDSNPNAKLSVVMQYGFNS